MLEIFGPVAQPGRASRPHKRPPCTREVAGSNPARSITINHVSSKPPEGYAVRKLKRILAG